MLRGFRPAIARVGMPMINGETGSEVYFDLWARAAEAQGVRFMQLPPINTPADVAPMLQAAQREQAQALLLATSPLVQRADSPVWEPIDAWAIEQKIVTISTVLARGKGVLTTGLNQEAFARLAAGQLDRVLRGADPAATPILQPTAWDMVVNQKLARAVGWPAPRPVLLQATEVIE